MKKWCTIIMCVLFLTSCTDKSASSQPAYDVERFAVYIVGGDSMTQVVYDLMANGEGTKYVIFPNRDDWPDLAPFDYFADDISSLDSSMYTAEPVVLDDATWQQMVDCLEENRFMELPEEIQSPGADVPHYYICVEANGITHIAGGWGATNEDSANGTRFKEIYDLFFSLIG